MSKKELHCSNTFNAFSLGSLKAKQIDFIFGIGYKMYIGKNLTAEIEEKEFKELVNYEKYSSIKRFHADVIAFLKAINAISFVHETKTEVSVRSLFEDLEFNKETRVLKVIARPIFLEFFNNVMQQEYTIIDLKDLTSLNSVYSKLMYKLLKQWSTRGWVQFNLEEMYNLLGVPKSTQSTGNFTNKVLKPIKQELPKYFNDLQIEPIRTGRKISSYKFTWKKSKSKILEAEVVEPIVIADKKVFEESIYRSEEFKKWWNDNIKEIKFYTSYIEYLENLKMNEVETKQYLIDQIACLNAGVHSGTVINAIKNGNRLSESVKIKKDSVLKDKKKDKIAQDVVNQDVMDLLEKPQLKEENKSIYTRDLLGIQQYLYAKTMYLKTMTIGEKTRLINNLKNIEEAIEAGERLEIDMTFFKLEEPKIVIEVAPEPEIQKESVKEKPQNNNQDKENSEFKETLTIIQNKVEDLEISMLEKIKLKMKIANCTKLDEIVNICIEYKINL
ncbi:MAG: replication initiation protein [Cetobacterium sp.]